MTFVLHGNNYSVNLFVFQTFCDLFNKPWDFRRLQFQRFLNYDPCWRSCLCSVQCEHNFSTYYIVSPPKMVRTCQLKRPLICKQKRRIICELQRQVCNRELHLLTYLLVICELPCLLPIWPLTYTVKKRLTIFLARESLVSDIPAGVVKIANLFLQCIWLTW